jgi:cytochrome c biogenesis protein CcdA
MTIAGIAITFVGFLIAVLSLGMTTDNTIRLVIVLVGLAVSLVGIMGVLNRACLNKAIWRK